MNWKDFLIGVTQLSLLSVAIVFIFCLVKLPVLAVRWYLLVRSSSSQSFWWHIQNFFQSIFFNLITPASLGSDAYRFIVAKRNKENTNIVLGLLIRERLMGLLGVSLFYLFCLTGLLINTNFVEIPEILMFIGIFIFVSLFVVLLIQLNIKWAIKTLIKYFPIKWHNTIIHITSSIGYSSVSEFIYLLILTLVAFTCWTMGAYYLTTSFGLSISFKSIGLVCVIAEFSRWLAITVQGIGVRESVFAYGYTLIGLPFEWGFLVGSIIYVLNAFTLLLFGAISANRRFMTYERTKKLSTEGI